MQLSHYASIKRLTKNAYRDKHYQGYHLLWKEKFTRGITNPLMCHNIVINVINVVPFFSESKRISQKVEKESFDHLPLPPHQLNLLNQPKISEDEGSV